MSNSDDVLIKVENVSKKFCRSLKRSMLYGMEDISRDLLHLSSTSDKLRKDEFCAVDDVSFEVKRGECLGMRPQSCRISADVKRSREYLRQWRHSRHEQ